MSAYERVVDALRAAGKRVQDRGDRALAQCPAHDDNRPSLSFARIEGQALLHCFAGCETLAVVQALDLTMADLFDNPRGATYVYPDNRRVHRTPDKTFRQSGNTKGRSLFRADRIAEASTVYVVEGEKDVLSVESAGGAAVCSAMGAGNADKFDWTPLSGKRVVIVGDKDKPGSGHVDDVAKLVHDIASMVQVVEPVEGKDFSDHYAAGHTLADLVVVDQIESKSSRHVWNRADESASLSRRVSSRWPRSTTCWGRPTRENRLARPRLSPTSPCL